MYGVSPFKSHLQAIQDVNARLLKLIGYDDVEIAFGLANDTLGRIPLAEMRRRRQAREGWREIYPERP